MRCGFGPERFVNEASFEGVNQVAMGELEDTVSDGAMWVLSVFEGTDDELTFRKEVVRKRSQIEGSA